MSSEIIDTLINIFGFKREYYTLINGYLTYYPYVSMFYDYRLEYKQKVTTFDDIYQIIKYIDDKYPHLRKQFEQKLVSKIEL